MPTAVENLGENRVRLTVDVSPDQVRARHRSRHVGPLREREDPRLPQGEDPDAGARVAARQGAHLRGGRGQPHRRLVLERRVAQPRAPGLRPAVRVRAAGHRGRRLELRRDGRGAGAPRARRLDDARGAARAEVEVPQESVDAEIEALREAVAELAPAGDRPAQRGRHARRRPRRLRRRGPARHRRRARRREARTRSSRPPSSAHPPARRSRSPSPWPTARARTSR